MKFTFSRVVELNKATTVMMLLAEMGIPDTLHDSIIVKLY